jgi:CheY-like chemotaxis protein
MSDGSQQGTNEVPSDAFVQQVRDALEHLYDLRCLQQHALVGGLAPDERGSAELPGKRLRRELVRAIETLNPGDDVPFLAPHARLHNVLTLHYLEKVTIQKVAYQLGISARQVQRDLRKGERSVATILWARRSTQIEQPPSTVELSSVQAEMARLQSRAQETNIGDLVEHAWNAVEPLAEQRAIGLEVHLSARPIVLRTDQMMAEQLLVNVLSLAVAESSGGFVYLGLTSEAEETDLLVRFVPRSTECDLIGTKPIVQQLAEQLGWNVQREQDTGGHTILRIRMTPRCPTILIIDDNEGLVELLQRYLSQHACRVVVADEGCEGLRLAREVYPEAIVLDVMMPGMAGWEVLQRLQSDPHTAAIPVVVCSVIDNPELAQALGASILLPKPIRQQDILSALRELRVV